jgi:hypothetical protein
MAAFISAYLLYRPLGSFVQFFITTRPPSDKQLASGIAAGKELLDRYARQRGPVASPWQRILNSGMLHVAAGSSGAFLLLKGLVLLFNIPIAF